MGEPCRESLDGEAESLDGEAESFDGEAESFLLVDSGTTFMTSIADLAGGCGHFMPTKIYKYI